MLSILGLPFLAVVAQAALVSYSWDISWLQANPDGRQSRPVIGINGQWPGPTIRASVGDTVAVTVTNSLGNSSASIHFHGIKQKGTAQMDGPPQVVACPIPPGDQFTYQFKITDPGTYWWHSHSDGQYIDGLRGPLIIEDPNSPYKGQYDDEIVMSVSDWYHDLEATLKACYLSPQCDPDGAEPVPYSALMNEGISPELQIQTGKTYFVRIMNVGAFAQVYLTFDQHHVEVIEVDGVYTQKYQTSSLYVATGQRYGVLLKAKNSASQNYGILASLNVEAFDNVPNYLDQNVTGYLVYNPSKPLPPQPVVPFFDVPDDVSFVPWDKQPALQNPTKKVTLDLSFFEAFGQNRAGFNNVSYLAPKVPTLYSALSAPLRYASDSRIYGDNTNAIVLNAYDVVEITINNLDDGQHPLHIHGHHVQLISRVPGAATGNKKLFVAHNATSSSSGGPQHNGKVAFPIRRDTFTLAASGQTVIRFVADNPGVWHFHCHMEWHLSAGLAAVLVEAPDQLQRSQSQIAPTMQQICKSQGIPLTGNAAGNKLNWLDLTGQTTSP